MSSEKLIKQDLLTVVLGVGGILCGFLLSLLEFGGLSSEQKTTIVCLPIMVGVLFLLKGIINIIQHTKKSRKKTR